MEDKANKHDWTSLMGGDKKKLLHELPLKFEDFLEATESSAAKSLWQVQSILVYTYIKLENVQVHTTRFFCVLKMSFIAGV